LQTPTNRQGSAGHLLQNVGERLSAAEAELHRIARAVYEERLTAGVAREQARKDLPLSTYTEAYWKIDLHNLLHFLQLRMDPHSQQEIRAYAATIGEQIVARWVPLVWEAFVDYRLRAVRWSRVEIEIVASVIAGAADRACELAAEAGFLRKNDRGETIPNRERAELESKLHIIGLQIPWK
jgi:thymidylate synthase (FAD)